MTPISPMIGSSITATVCSVVAALIASRSLYGTCTKPSGSGLKGSEYLGWPPAVIVAIVRPWNEPIEVMIWNAPFLLRTPHLRAILIAASFASAPELPKKTRAGKDSSTRRCASSTCGWVKYRLDAWMRAWAWLATAAAHEGDRQPLACVHEVLVGELGGGRRHCASRSPPAVLPPHRTSKDRARAAHPPTPHPP